ncbi:unnamed protein product [Heterobilharzia americana]|nr:unnamed protein product [Heterobilharzia americana]
MLHELLLALHGIAGGVFSESTTETENDLGLTKYLIPISKSLPLIPQGELVLYTKLLRLGTCYGYLERFVRNFSVPNYGLYVSAFAFGIDASLSEYRADLHSLETELLMHADLGASHLCYRLHSYNILLPILVKITKKVKNIIEEPESLCDNPSCRVLDVIISATPAGLLGPRFTIQKLVYHVVQVLYRQLLSWLIYGVLHDPYSEFFIKRVNPDSLTFMELSTYSPVDVSVTDDSLETKPVFVVDVHRIPSFLSTLFAQRVLATGEVMCFISSDPSEAPFLLELEKTYYRGFSEIPTCFEESGDKQFDEKIFRNPLDVRKINNLVCEIHNVVSYHAWHSLMNKHKLVQYLHLVKDVLLLGRGELFLAFFDQLNISSDLSDLESEINFKITHNILDKPPPTDDSEIRDLESNITAAFLGAARSLGLNDEMLNTSFKFLIRFKKASHEDEMTQNLTVWDCLHIQITVPSPLECLFSAQICCAYDRLFRFVSSIRRTQLKLQHYWLIRFYYGVVLVIILNSLQATMM